jgi:hypothetical protein
MNETERVRYAKLEKMREAEKSAPMGTIYEEEAREHPILAVERNVERTFEYHRCHDISMLSNPSMRCVNLRINRVPTVA